LDVSVIQEDPPMREHNGAPVVIATGHAGAPGNARMRRAVPSLTLFLFLQSGNVEGAAATAEEFKKAVEPCMRVRAYECAEKNWTYYIQLRPKDSNAIANLGIVLSLEGKHEQAVVQLKKAVAMGEGTYDLFAYLAKSLEALGRTDEAIDWSYKALAVVPELVDVRGDLAKLLVSKGRHYEALALLTSFDAKLESSGQRPYFEGQRIAIESSMAPAPASSGANGQRFRVSKLGDHFYVPVRLGSSTPRGFVIDTGAAATSISDDLLAASKAKYTIANPSVSILLADGHRRTARALTVAALQVGPFELRDVEVIACKNCVLLLGQSTLSRFDMISSRFQGVEFLTLSPRSPMAIKAEAKSGASQPDDGQHGGAPEQGSALAVARECLDLDDSLGSTKRRLDDASQTAKERADRLRDEGRELTEIRKGLGSADQSTIDSYNRRIETLNQAIDRENHEADELAADQDRFNDAVHSRNEKCGDLKLTDRDYQIYKKERDARRKAVSSPEASATTSDGPKP
jgi:tetratricopeptide (TPR) repeat protein